MKNKINSSTISTSLGEKTIILNIESGKYYELNNSSSLLWSMIEKGKSDNEIIKKITSTYKINTSDATESLIKFTSLCKKYGFLN